MPFQRQGIRIDLRRIATVIIIPVKILGLFSQSGKKNYLGFLLVISITRILIAATGIHIHIFQILPAAVVASILRLTVVASPLITIFRFQNKNTFWFWLTGVVSKLTGFDIGLLCTNSDPLAVPRMGGWLELLLVCLFRPYDWDWAWACGFEWWVETVVS